MWRSFSRAAQRSSGARLQAGQGGCSADSTGDHSLTARHVADAVADLDGGVASARLGKLELQARVGLQHLEERGGGAHG